MTGANWGWNSLLVDSLLQHVVVGGFGFVFQFLVLFYLKKYPVSSWHSVAYIYDLTDPLFGNNESADWVVTLFFYFLKMKEGIGDYFIQIILCMWPMYIKRRTYKVVDSWSHYSRLFPFYFISIFFFFFFYFALWNASPHSPLYSAHTSIFNTFSNFQFEWVSPLSAHDLNRASILNISPLSFSIVYYTTTTSGLGFVAGQKVAFSFSFTYIRTVYSTYTSFPGLLPSLFLPIPGRESRAENRHCCVAVKLIKCWPNARLRRPNMTNPTINLLSLSLSLSLFVRRSELWGSNKPGKFRLRHVPCKLVV